MRIGEAARRAGVSTRALRYYEERGLVQTERTLTGQRIYTDSSVQRARLIQELFGAGLSSELLVTLLPAIDARRLDPDLSQRLEAEHRRLESEVTRLQTSSRRLAALIRLAANPDEAACPATLDEAVARGLPSVRASA